MPLAALAGLVRDQTMPIRDRNPIQLGPFSITPYLVDHSAYDAYALLVEADGRRLLYSGDFRGHGRKASLFERLLREPPHEVDVLLMEGTTMSRGGAAEGFPTESDLEARFVTHFRETEGLALVWTSSQNIDRLVTIVRACRQTGRQLIIDLYTAEVLQATGNPNIPQGTWDGVRVFLTHGQRRTVKEHRLFDLVRRYKGNRIFPENLATEAAQSVILFRPALRRELDAAGCVDRARLAYSLWEGYLRDPRQTPLLAWLTERGITMETIHTSGHASPRDLARFAQAIDPRYLVPIHTFAPDNFDALFPRIETKSEPLFRSIASKPRAFMTSSGATTT
ncbi:MAG: MBL fold metallo-hydrolase [Alphaproteobacteria bacterium]|nr:MBL fold metallo-hydrolase [Alphaproteobacteria bacterium]